MILFEVASCGISILPLLVWISLDRGLVLMHNITNSSDGDGCGHIGDGVDLYKCSYNSSIGPTDSEALTTLVSVVTFMLLHMFDPLIPRV